MYATNQRDCLKPLLEIRRNTMSMGDAAEPSSLKRTHKVITLNQYYYVYIEPIFHVFVLNKLITTDSFSNSAHSS
jgi:hypothetical protein